MDAFTIESVEMSFIVTMTPVTLGKSEGIMVVNEGDKLGRDLTIVT